MNRLSRTTAIFMGLLMLWYAVTTVLYPPIYGWLQGHAPPQSGKGIEFFSLLLLCFLPAWVRSIAHIHGPWMMRECIRQLNDHRPAAVLVEWKDEKIVLEEQYRPILDFIDAHYKPGPRMGRMGLLIPK